MSGVRHIVVGLSGCGKSTYTRKEIIESFPKDYPKIIYDINQEYTDIYTESFEDFDIFLRRQTDKENRYKHEIRHSYLLFEEATIFFDSHQTAEEMKNLLVRARHTNNYIQLNFHSISSIPKYIKNLIDYITIFKTGDSEKDVIDKFGKGVILEAWKHVQENKDPKYNKGAQGRSIYHRTVRVY